MATWNSRGLRGSTLEELINRTNDQYREKGLALIQKIPTPITPVKMDKNSRHAPPAPPQSSAWFRSADANDSHGR